MKKVSLMIAALALVLGISQCKKQEKPVQAGEKQYIELTAGNGNDGSKVGGSFSAATMNLFWEEGDVITVSGGATGTLTLNDGAGTAQGHFSGEVTLDSRADLVFTWTKLEGEPDFNNQTGTEEWITDNLVLEAKAAYNESGKYNLKMEMPYAVLKLDLRALVGESGNDVEIKVGSGAVATVKSLAKANSNEVYVAVPVDRKHVYTFSGNNESIIKTWTLETNTFYTAGTAGSPVVIFHPEGAIKGVFTVADPDRTPDSGDETKIYFSQGNLQYIGSATTPYWKFADNQYDVLRTATGQNSDAQDVDRDLFGWGTSGYNHGATCYQPWSTSQTYSDYYAYGSLKNSLWEGLAPNTGKADWGKANAISNGGNVAGKWRTLSNEEWQYLLNYGSFANDKRESKCKLAEVMGVFGLVLAPDECLNGYTFDNTETTYDETAWTTAEEGGCVFLPAAGYRDGVSFKLSNFGIYWSSSTNNVETAFRMFFHDNTFMPNSGTNRSFGCSVRLVSEN